MTAALALGACWGALSSLTNAAASPVGVAASLIVNSGWAWAGVAVAAGALARGRLLGAGAGVLALLAMTTAYYGTDSVLRGEPFAMYLAELQLWAVAALLLGSVLGVVGASIRRSGVVGLLAGLTVPVGAALEMLWLPRWPAGPTAPAALDEIRIAVLTGAVLTASAVITSHVRRREPVASPSVASRAS